MEVNRDSNQLGNGCDGIDQQVSQQVATVNDLASQIANLKRPDSSG